MNNETHQRILALRAQRLTYAVIAKELGLALGTVSGVCKEYSTLPSDQPVPEGMSLLTARDIERVTGLWLSEENAVKISKRALDILGAYRRRNTMPELGKWLKKLDLVP
jgi:hypothetical protein